MCKMFPNFSEGYYDSLAEHLIQVLNYFFLSIFIENILFSKVTIDEMTFSDPKLQKETKTGYILK